MLKISVLIPSFKRPVHLQRTLDSLARQTRLPTEVIVVWQGDDQDTRAVVEAARALTPYLLHVVHLPTRGIVPAENAALEASSGDIICLIDDDAVAAPDWIERHVAHYQDPSVGAVGGPATNFTPAGEPFRTREAEPIGKLTWYGRTLGNMYDHPAEWRSRPSRDVDHLVGYNMSLRRTAFTCFQSALKSYWQLFELEACLQVRSHGYRVLFDFANVVEHHPTNTVYAAGRDGDLTVKVENPAFNLGWLLGRHSPSLLRPIRLLYALGIGSSSLPGAALLPLTIARYGDWRRELRVGRLVQHGFLAGWKAGSISRASSSD